MKKLLGLILIVFFPVTILANAGTPLIWAGIAHLYIGNFCIGIIETFLIRKETKKLKIWIVGIVIIIANYLSMLVGMVLYSSFSNLFDMDLFNPSETEYIWQNIFLYSSLTITSFLIELPFFYSVLRINNKMSLLKTAVKINSISAIIVIIYYIVFQWGLV